MMSDKERLKNFMDQSRNALNVDIFWLKQSNRCVYGESASGRKAKQHEIDAEVQNKNRENIHHEH